MMNALVEFLKTTLITQTRQDIDAVEQAPVPLAEAEVHLVARLDELAALYEVDDALATFRRDPPPRLDALEQLLPDPRFDPLLHRAFVATIHRDELLAVWRARLAAQYAANPELARSAIPVQERPARLAALRTRLRDLELAEEVAITQAERRGLTLDRREDCNPAVLFAPEVLDAEDAG